MSVSEWEDENEEGVCDHCGQPFENHDPDIDDRDELRVRNIYTCPPTIKGYTLQATRGRDKSVRWRIYTEPGQVPESLGKTPQDRSDWDAALQAIRMVMDFGSRWPLWAKGHVVLTRDDGMIIHEMPEKVTH